MIEERSPHVAYDRDYTLVLDDLLPGDPPKIAEHGSSPRRRMGGGMMGGMGGGGMMGGGRGGMTALEEQVDGLVCLGYPLRGEGGTFATRCSSRCAPRCCSCRDRASRFAPSTPSSGPRADGRALVAAFRRGGNHSLEVGVRPLAARGETQEDVDARALAAIAAFLRRLGK